MNSRSDSGISREEVSIPALPVRPEGSIPDVDLHWRISIYILFRMGLATLFLVFVAMRVFREDGFDAPGSRYAFYLVAATFLLMGLSAWGLRAIRSLQSFAYLQHVVDTVLVTVLICQTGGLESLFTVLYFM